MTIRDHRACGFCAEFNIGIAQPDQGTSACRQGNPGNSGTSVHATQRPCVLFMRVRDVKPREKFVANLRQLEPA